MKKKLLATITALSLAATCASALVACGDDTPGKHHTKEQWQNAFDTISKTDYALEQFVQNKEANSYEFNMGLYCDKTDDAYMLVTNTGTEGYHNSLLQKKGDRYYTAKWGVNDVRFAELISPEDFSTKSDEMIDTFGNTIDGLIMYLRDGYGQFGAGGGGHYEDADGNLIKLYDYECKNYSVKIDGEEAAVFDDVMVRINEKNVLEMVSIKGLDVSGDEKAGITYQFGDGSWYINDALSSIHMLYPEVLGQTFTLESVNVDTNVGTFEEMARDMENEYKNEAVTCAANGKLSGNIQFDGKAISQFTLTDDYGDITVEGPDNITLTGECFINSDISEICLKLYLTIPTQNGDVTFTFTFVRY